MTFDYFVGVITPVVSDIIERIGLDMPVLDLGWPPLTSMAWSFKFAPLLLVVLMIINILMIVFKLTKTVNIDIWNYWHLIFIGALVYFESKNILLTFIITIASFILILKLAEWTAKDINKAMDMDGICVTHLASLIHYPLALVGNNIIEKIPGLNRIDADAEAIQKKLGLFGQPMFIGLILGLLLGLTAGYEIKKILEVGVRFAAVIYILPIMSGILGDSLIPISEGMKNFLKKIPNMDQAYIGLDVAVLFRLPENMVTMLLLIPTSIVLAIILPGVNFIPLGDLTSILLPVAFITLATGGNIIRSYIIGIPILIGSLYGASYMAPTLTNMALDMNYNVVDNAMFTSFIDGGNSFRLWIVTLLRGNLIAMLFIPIIFLLLYYTYRHVKKSQVQRDI